MLQHRPDPDMKIIDAAAVHAALPFERLIPALRDTFAGPCEVPRRHVHEIVTPGVDSVTSLIMPAWIPGRYYGVKVINMTQGNAGAGPAGAARDLPAA
jgi:ornithine cyclodeaminase